MLKSKVIFILLPIFTVATLAATTGPAVAHYGFWHRGPSHFARHPAQFRQESAWRRWGSARQTSHQSMQRHPERYEEPPQPHSIGAYNPGNTPGPRFMNASSSRPNAGYGGGHGNAGSSYQGAGFSYQGAGSSSHGAGSSPQSVGSLSRNTDSSSAAGSQPSETHYICIVAMGYCGFNGRPNIPPRSLCHCGSDSGLTR